MFCRDAFFCKLIDLLHRIEIFVCLEKMSVIPSSDGLPLSTSASLALVHPTEAERRATWLLNGQSWRGALSLPAYLRREEVLGNQSLTSNGGLSFWVLVETSTAPSTPRRILASCETIRKRALIAKPGHRVEEVVSHGIGSVFCDPQLRGRGYAGRMMRELGQRLDTWRQEAGISTDFTVLFSDIGKVGDPETPERHCWSKHLTSPLEILCKVWVAPLPFKSHCIVTTVGR